MLLILLVSSNLTHNFFIFNSFFCSLKNLLLLVGLAITHFIFDLLRRSKSLILKYI
nr:MAG TPA: hypothetical protein [Caudoviricetes sp.]